MPGSALRCAMLVALALGGGCAEDTGEETDRQAAEPDAKKPDEGAVAPPSTKAPKPDTSTREPDTSAPKPDTSAPKPDTSTREPDTGAPEPDTRTDEDSTDGRGGGTGTAVIDSPFVTDLRANGTGCPAGTWSTTPSADGKSIVVRLSEYVAEVTPDEPFATKDCSLALKVPVQAGKSYSLRSARYTGSALLEAGVSAWHSVSYYFQGSPPDSARAETELKGPYDDAFSFDAPISPSKQVWSACGAQRDLNVVTRIRLQNGTPRASGTIALERVLELELEWRACQP